MNPESLAVFFFVRLMWALLPGPGLVVVLSRSLSSGPVSGCAVVAGLVLADLLFLAIAMIGLQAIAATLGPMFQG